MPPRCFSPLKQDPPNLPHRAPPEILLKGVFKGNEKNPLLKHENQAGSRRRGWRRTPIQSLRNPASNLLPPKSWEPLLAPFGGLLFRPVVGNGRWRAGRGGLEGGGGGVKCFQRQLLGFRRRGGDQSLRVGRQRAEAERGMDPGLRWLLPGPPPPAVPPAPQPLTACASARCGGAGTACVRVRARRRERVKRGVRQGLAGGRAGGRRRVGAPGRARGWFGVRGRAAPCVRVCTRMCAC